MRPLLEVARTGLDSVLLHPLRSFVCCAAVVVVLTPYLAGLALSKGIEAQAEESAQLGADLYISGSRFGRPAPIPLGAIADIPRIDGVEAVVPRIVGEVILGKDHVRGVLVGLPPAHLTSWPGSIDGRLPRDGGPHELVIGTALARRLGLKIGDALLPFYHNNRGVRISRVVGTFKPDAPLWQANLCLATFDTAAYIFDQPGLATDLLVWCEAGQSQQVAARLLQGMALAAPSGADRAQPRVTLREDLLALLPLGPLHRQGVFTLHFVLAFVMAVLVLLVASGLGLDERRREIGVLKATGWQTDEVLLRGAVESLCLSLGGACVSLLGAWAWLRLCNGCGLAGFFLGGADLVIENRMPFRLTPVPALLSFVLSFVVVAMGTLYSAWRAATVSPRDAMR